MSLAIANRYARALADILTEPGSGVEPEAALSQLRSFAGLLEQSAELRNLLLSPAVAVAGKRAVAERLCGMLGMSPLLKNFLKVVLDHRRAGELSRIADALEAAIDERLDRVRAEVVSAAPLDEARRGGLTEELARVTGKQVRSEFRVDPELLGGVSVRIGSTIYDGSVRGRLESLRRKLAAG